MENDSWRILVKSCEKAEKKNVYKRIAFVFRFRECLLFMNLFAYTVYEV